MRTTWGVCNALTGTHGLRYIPLGLCWNINAVNYLAHLFLANDDPEEQLGSLIADFTRGRIVTLAERYSPGIMHGITIHRQIDSFTDQHIHTEMSRQRFSPERRRFARIIVDITHDHFLNKHWVTYSTQDRRQFIDRMYRLLELNHYRLPSRLQQLAPRMIQDDWLGSYIDLEILERVFDGMSSRMKRPNRLAGALDEVKANYEGLEQDFSNFFPGLMAYVHTL